MGNAGFLSSTVVVPFLWFVLRIPNLINPKPYKVFLKKGSAMEPLGRLEIQQRSAAADPQGAREDPGTLGRIKHVAGSRFNGFLKTCASSSCQK